MLNLYRHPPGTTFECALMYAHYGVHHKGGGVVIVAHSDSAQALRQTFYGPEDVIRTSVPLDRYGNKTCYHDRAIGTIYLNEGDSLAGPIDLSTQNYPWVDYDTFVANCNNDRPCQTVLQGSPLGFSFVRDSKKTTLSKLSDVHGAEYSQTSKFFDFGDYVYYGNAYSQDTVTLHYCLNNSFEIRRVWMLGGKFPIGLQIFRPNYEGGETLVSFYAGFRRDSQSLTYYGGYTFIYHKPTGKWTITSVSGNQKLPGSASTVYFEDLIETYHPHHSVVKDDPEVYSRELIISELIALSDAVIASPVLDEIEAAVLSCYDGTKFMFQTYSTTSVSEFPYYWSQSGITIGNAGEVRSLSLSEKKEINRSISLFNDVCVSTDPPVAWGDLGNECADQVALTDVNVLAYLADLKDFGSSAKSAYSFLKDPPTVRSGASAYLSARFGDRLTVSDTKQLFDDLTGKLVTGLSNAVIPTRTRRKVSTPPSSLFYPIQSQEEQQCYFAWFQPNDYIGLDRAISTLMQLGLWLDTKNAWDLVPMSFVVDWFVNVSEFFETIDRWVANRYFSVVSVCRSRRVESKLDANLWRSKYPFLTSVCHVRYFREVTHRLDSTPFCVEWSVPSLVNILDGAALLIQR